MMLTLLALVPSAPGTAQQSSPSIQALRDYRGAVEPIRKFVFSARCDGLLSKIGFIPGQIVNEGDPVIEFRTTEKQLDLDRKRALRQRADAELRGAETTLERFRKLGQTNAISTGQIKDAEVARDVAATKLEEARANEKEAELIVGDMQLRAPFAGIMSAPYVSIGTYIDLDARTSRPLAEIIQLDPIWVVYKVPFAVYYERRKAMASDTEVLQRLDLSLVFPNGEVYPHKGRVTFIDYQVDQATQAIAVRAEFPNSDYLLRPGLEVTIQSRILDKQQSTSIGRE